MQKTSAICIYGWCYMLNVSTIRLQQPAVQTPASYWKYLVNESSVSEQNNHIQSSTAGGLHLFIN